MTGIELTDVQREILTGGRLAVLATIHADGRPQLSTVAYTWSPTANVARVSITADRAKYRNLVRDPRAALHVQRDRGYVVVEGTVTLLGPAEDKNDPAIDELVDIYRSIAGEHPDWDDYRRAMVEDRRVAVTLHPSRIHGLA